MEDKHKKEDGMVEIPLKDYKSLLESEAWLTCLELAGVDNWDGYDSAYEIWDEEYSKEFDD